MIIDRIIPRHAELIAQRRAQQELGAVKRGVVGLIAVSEGLLAEQIAAERDPRAERVRVGEAEFEAAGILAVHCRRLGDVAGAEKISIADADLGQHPVGCGITAGDGEIPCLLLLDRDVQGERSGAEPCLVPNFTVLK